MIWYSRRGYDGVIGTRKRDVLQKKLWHARYGILGEDMLGDWHSKAWRITEKIQSVNGKGNTLHSSSIAALQNIIYGAQFNYLDSIKNHKIGLKMGREAIQLRYVS